MLKLVFNYNPKKTKICPLVLLKDLYEFVTGMILSREAQRKNKIDYTILTELFVLLNVCN
jgi:hypothetical protein